MKNTLLFILTLLLLSSCMRVINPKERNVISFENDIRNVTTAIQEMNGLLAKYDKVGFSYVISNDTCLFVETSGKFNKVGCFNDTLSLLYESEMLSFLEMKNERKRCIELIKFLNKNHLTSVLKRKNKYLFRYRNNIYMADRQEDLNRYIVYAKDELDLKELLEDDLVKAAHGGMYNLSYKIINKKGHLFLLANKDAKIWTGSPSL